MSEQNNASGVFIALLKKLQHVVTSDTLNKAKVLAPVQERTSLLGALCFTPCTSFTGTFQCVCFNKKKKGAFTLTAGWQRSYLWSQLSLLSRIAELVLDHVSKDNVVPTLQLPTDLQVRDASGITKLPLLLC